MSGRRRKESGLLRLSQRSNGLAFSHHHYLLASSTPLNDFKNPILSDINGNSLVRSSDGAASIFLEPVEENSDNSETVKVISRPPVRSLIPPVIPMRGKTEPSTIRKRRTSSSSASIRSFASSMMSRRRACPVPTLINVPVEILDNIFKSLAQHDLHSLMLSNPNFIEVAARSMYLRPQFASTYRFAQFTFTVQNNTHYADMVRVLDLSPFGYEGYNTGRNAYSTLEPMAGWREWKYRNSETYYFQKKAVKFIPCEIKDPKSSHPGPSPSLQNFHGLRDIPMGMLFHVMAACKRIVELNLSRVQLSGDFVAKRQRPERSPVKYTSEITSKSWMWRSSSFTRLNSEDLIRAILRLPSVECLKLRHCLWLSTDKVNRMMIEAGDSLKRVDLRGSGMEKEVRWATKGSRSDIQRIVGEVVFNRKMVEFEDEF